MRFSKNYHKWCISVAERTESHILRATFPLEPLCSFFFFKFWVVQRIICFPRWINCDFITTTTIIINYARKCRVDSRVQLRSDLESPDLDWNSRAGDPDLKHHQQNQFGLFIGSLLLYNRPSFYKSRDSWAICAHPHFLKLINLFFFKEDTDVGFRHALRWRPQRRTIMTATANWVANGASLEDCHSNIFSLVGYE